MSRFTLTSRTRFETMCDCQVSHVVRRRGENLLKFFFIFLNLQCKFIYIYGDTKQILSFIGRKWNGSRHLVFWSLGTLTGLRDRVRGLVA
jgi:hypothetical protein